MEKRNLVGRRYEDYLTHDILIELSADECLWRMVLQDPRYNHFIERRTGLRRKGDQTVKKINEGVNSGNLRFVESLLTDD